MQNQRKYSVRCLTHAVCGGYQTIMRAHSLIVRSAVFLLITLCLSGLALAQGTSSGDIRGTVTDPSGAVVQGAKVTVLNVDTGVSLVYTTNNAGLFDTVSILAGNYRITFDKEGFEGYTVGGIVLQAGDPQTVNGRLTVGKMATTINVNAESPLLKTESSEQSTTLEEEAIKELPSVNRDWTQLTKILPGSSGNNAGGGVSLNGIEPWEANWLSDGGVATNSHSANADPIMYETVAEIQIQTSNFTAQYGTGSIVFNQITKSGSNKWHGSAYEFLQNDFLNSVGYGSTTVPNKRYDNYGFSASGPMIKNKAFFFFNWDKIHNNSTSAAGPWTVPTDDMKAGDFSGYIAAYNAGASAANQIAGIFVPGSAVAQPIGPASTCNGLATGAVTAANSFYCRTTMFPGNKIPTSLMDPVALAIQKYYPEPNYNGGANKYTNNFKVNSTTLAPWAKYFGRADIQFSDSNRLTMAVTLQDNPNQNPGYTFVDGNVDSYTGDVESWNTSVTDIWTISPSLVNEARVGFQREDDHYSQNSMGQNYPATLGWKYAQANMFPQINVGGVYGEGGLGTTNNTATYAENALSPNDTITWIHGRHVLHFGGEVLKFMDNNAQWGDLGGGSLSFWGNYTASATKGVQTVGYADFLLGDSQSFSSYNKPINADRETEPQFFAQDDFKVTPNLTLNIGARYQIMTGWHENHNNLGAFDPTLYNPGYTQPNYSGNNSTGTGGNPFGAMWFANSDGRTNLQQTVNDIFLPRGGFSWSTHKLVIRGGAGLFIQPWSEDGYASNAEGVGAEVDCNLSDNTNVAPSITLSAPASTNLNCIKASRSPSAYNYIPGVGGGNVQYYPYNTPVTTIYQWSLGVQRELIGAMVAELAFVGNHDTHMPFNADFNQVPLSNMLASYNAGGQVAQDLRPYPQFQSINANYGNANGTGNYDALQASLKKRLSHGLSFDANYTWSKMLNEGDSSGWGGAGGNFQNSYDPKASYGPSNNNRAQLIKGDAVYTLPFGKGRTFLNQSGPLDYILGGWQASGIVTISSGQPFTVYWNGTNKTGAMAGSLYPDLLGNPYQAGTIAANPTCVGPATVKTHANWYNPCAYGAPNGGNPGGFGNDGRNTLVGPGWFDLDFSMAKSFPVPMLENGRFQIRLDANNATNHTSYGNPNNNVNGTASDNSGLINGAANSIRTVQLGGRFSF